MIDFMCSEDRTKTTHDAMLALSSPDGGLKHSVVVCCHGDGALCVVNGCRRNVSEAGINK